MRFLLLNLLVLASLGLSLEVYGYSGPSCNENLVKLLRAENSGRLGPRVFNRYRGQSQHFVEELKVASFNTYEKLKHIEEFKTRRVNHRSLTIMSDFILKNDVISLQEVDSFKSLEIFNEHYLANEYRIFFLQSNDTNASHIAFLVRKSLPVDVELRSHKYYKKVYKEKMVNIFSRDLPLLMFRRPGQHKTDAPFITFAGVHYKSMGHSKNDDFSFEKRHLQVEATSEVIEKEFYQRFGRKPLVMLGDFNSDVNSHEFELLRKHGFIDTLDIVNFNYNDRITHNYFGNDGTTERRQMDALLINNPQRIEVIKSEIHYYQDHQGREIPLPRDIDERNLLPSDHYPVWAHIKIRKY